MDERFELNQRKAIREGWEDENFFLPVMFSSASQCYGSDSANSRIIRRLHCRFAKNRRSKTQSVCYVAYGQLRATVRLLYATNLAKEQRTSQVESDRIKLLRNRSQVNRSAQARALERPPGFAGNNSAKIGRAHV